MTYRIQRLAPNPIIHPGLDPSIGTNINGPSLVPAPSWLPCPLGRYYLYFAHHSGTTIRLAFADHLQGPWRIYSPGTLALGQTPCRGHIASPDVHIDTARKTVRMYFHGPTPHGQVSFLAESRDGLDFKVISEPLGPFYFRVFQYAGFYYAIAKILNRPGGGIVLRSRDGKTPFEPGPDILPRQRHVAVHRNTDQLDIFLSRGEDMPESILHATLDLTGDWTRWKPSEPALLAKPETDREGARLPLTRSSFGPARTPVHELRDPAFFEENGIPYLLYSVAGESGIAIARLIPVNHEETPCAH
ncbi:MAG: hypothetical protein A2498_11460 [Lentisphaerae bacterium RIFOXYC12_FULL_60_16]|nr:MAG: hypothetical protein A2498_11460 [Lentisphaerae bacterium RIFOXYC12_FULL_60_16]OGV83662.1 MAG: hypothetical protein A2340_11550 [Lentisphaerae bacterium RIFOXYB12_FULL_60_10]